MTRFRNWFQARSPRGQWAVGCAVTVLVVTLCLYSLGFASFLVRPALVTTPPPETVVVSIPTAVVRPTFAPPTAPPSIILPGSTLEATPTQAPIPTRVPPTNTPLYILDPGGTPVTITPMYVPDENGILVTATPNPFATSFPGQITLVPEQ